jgi:midasin (ATPase involved in ribosome maturation)
MILYLISINISNTLIYLQDTPGSGKSCVSRHYSAYRSFQSRNLILSVNYHRDLKFYYLVRTYIFKNSKFHFVEGPLLTAMRNGESILLDEFNLCPENVLINLLPIFKANINDKIYLKGVPEPVYISPGFFIIATGNSSKEKGRNVISSIISDEIKIVEIESFNLITNTSLIKNILVEEYNDIYQPNDKFDHYKISPEQIEQIDDALKTIVQFRLSLRQIKCLLNRINRFCLKENYETNGLKKIPVIYVIISYIIPQLKIGRKLEELLEKFVSIMKYEKLDEILDFFKSKVEFESIYIKVGEKKKKKIY